MTYKEPSATSSEPGIITISGDLGGTSTSPSVVKINGSSVPAGGSLTTGNVLQVTGSTALSYSAVNLAGGSNFITGNLPVSNVAPGTSAQVLMSNGTPATAWTSLTGDVTVSATGGTKVNSIAGSTPIAITPAELQWATATTSPKLDQAPTSSGSGTNLTIQAQSATGASNNGGNLILTGGTSGSAIGGFVSVASGQLTHAITITSSTYAVDTNSTTSDYVIFTDSTSNTITITLPTPTAGRTLIIKDKTGKASTNNITVAQHSSETIDGNNSFVIFTNYTSITLISDGTNWSLV